LTPYIAAEIGTELEEKYWSQSAEVELLWSFHVLLTSIVQMTQSSQCIYLHATSDVLLTSISGVSENNFCTICYLVEWWSCTESNPSSLSTINLKFISNTWSLSWGRHAESPYHMYEKTRCLMHLTYQRYLTLQNSSRYSNK
jgi:hypothetical protein